MRISLSVRSGLMTISSVLVALLLSACGGEKSSPTPDPSPVGVGSVTTTTTTPDTTSGTRVPSGPDSPPTPVPPPPVPPPVVPIPPTGLRAPDEGENPDDSDNFFVRQTLRVIRGISRPRP